jgi:hypothetical protein
VLSGYHRSIYANPNILDKHQDYMRSSDSIWSSIFYAFFLMGRIYEASMDFSIGGPETERWCTCNAHIAAEARTQMPKFGVLIADSSGNAVPVLLTWRHSTPQVGSSCKTSSKSSRISARKM